MDKLPIELRRLVDAAERYGDTETGKQILVVAERELYIHALNRSPIIDRRDRRWLVMLSFGLALILFSHEMRQPTLSTSNVIIKMTLLSLLLWLTGWVLASFNREEEIEIRRRTLQNGLTLSLARRSHYIMKNYGVMFLSIGMMWIIKNMDPMYLHSASELYVPRPVMINTELGDINIRIPGFESIDSKDELIRITRYYQERGNNHVNSVFVPLMLRDGGQSVCVTATMIFEKHNEFSCRGFQCLEYLQRCAKDVTKKFSIVPIQFLSDQIQTHDIVLIINHERKELEMYDSFGVSRNYMPQYQSILRYVQHMAELGNYRFLGQVSFGFHLLEHVLNHEICNMSYVYMSWLVEIRFLNPQCDIKELDQKIVMYLKDRPWAIYEYLKPRLLLMTGIPLDVSPVYKRQSSVDLESDFMNTPKFQFGLNYVANDMKIQISLLRELLSDPDLNVTDLQFVAQQQLDRLYDMIRRDFSLSSNRSSDYLLRVIDWVTGAISFEELSQATRLLWRRPSGHEFSELDLKTIEDIEEKNDIPTLPIASSSASTSSIRRLMEARYEKSKYMDETVDGNHKYIIDRAKRQYDNLRKRGDYTEEEDEENEENESESESDFENDSM